MQAEEQIEGEYDKSKHDRYLVEQIDQNNKLHLLRTRAQLTKANSQESHFTTSHYDAKPLTTNSHGQDEIED